MSFSLQKNKLVDKKYSKPLVDGITFVLNSIDAALIH